MGEQLKQDGLRHRAVCLQMSRFRGLLDVPEVVASCTCAGNKEQGRGCQGFRRWECVKAHSPLGDRRLSCLVVWCRHAGYDCQHCLCCLSVGRNPAVTFACWSPVLSEWKAYLREGESRCCPPHGHWETRGGQLRGPLGRGLWFALLTWVAMMLG